MLTIFGVVVNVLVVNVLGGRIGEYVHKGGELLSEVEEVGVEFPNGAIIFCSHGTSW